MTFGAEIWGPAAINAVGSIGGGLLSGGGNKETRIQRRQRKLIDKLLGSLDGEGPYSDLFNADEDAFQKSFVEPAQSMFRNQIAPQIQQQSIASGQQRGTGLDDQLLRAGVDLDSMLNQQYYQFNQDALNRKQGAMNSILGSGSGAPNTPSFGQNLGSAVGGYLGGDAFKEFTKDATGYFQPGQQNTTAPSTAPGATPPRKGYSADWSDYQLGDSRWGQ
jgi:hypothetical protein